MARGTISVANLTTGGSTASSDNYATASISPTADRLVLAWVCSWDNPSIDPPVLSGNDLTWVQIATVQWGDSDRYTTTLYRAMGSAPTTGTVDIVFNSGEAQSACVWSIVEIAGVDTRGVDGSGAILQIYSAFADTVTTINATLTALEDASNAHFSGCTVDLNTTTNDAITEDTQFTELGQWDEPNNNMTIQSSWALNEITCDPTFASANAAVISVEVRSAAPTDVSDVILPRPESFNQTLEYKTDVLSSKTGSEHRLLLSEHPRETWDLDIILENEARIRKWKADLFKYAGTTFKLPLWNESLTLTAAASATDTVINADTTLVEIAQDDQLLLVGGIDEGTLEVVTVVSLTSSTITVTPGLSNAYLNGERIVPLRNGYLPDNLILSRFPTEGATVSLSFVREDYAAATGKGAPSITQYSSINVLDRRPLNNDPVQETYFSSIEIIDFGNKQQIHKFYDEAKIQRELRFLIDTKSERQYWKAFLAACKGQREPFLVPTWRPDFVLAQQPSQGSAVIKITSTPDIIKEYSGSLSHDWLYLQTDGIDHFSSITSYLDNGDGTIDITMTTALNNDPDDSTINVVSHMEQSRLGSDVVRLQHFDNHSVISLSVAGIQA